MIQARRNLVVGLGKTGLSAVRWLSAHGEAVMATDSREDPPCIEEVKKIEQVTAVHVGAFDISLLDQTDRMVISPGVSPREPIVQSARARGIPVVGDVELFATECVSPVVGITGTNGKSTVTTLVAEMARSDGLNAIAGGNLGEPALDLLSQPRPDLYVLELSSFQLESTYTLKLAVAAVLNVTPDHMDRYESLEAYASAKARILSNAKVAVLNIDDPAVANMAHGIGHITAFSLENQNAAWRVSEHDGASWIVGKERPLIKVSELKLAGAHNVANALAALAIGDHLGISISSMLLVLRSFPGLPHRSEWVAEHKGVRFIDDSKGTNVGATLAAVTGFSEKLVVIAGGDGKSQDFTPLAAAFKNRVRHAVLIGRDRERIAGVLANVCSVEFAADMSAAVAAAAKAAQPGDSVLLSPACASFDMFQDYAHRGDVFAAAARKLNS